MAATLPVTIPEKSAAATNKQEIFNFADELEKPDENTEREAETKMFGRYFYLEGYIHPEKMPFFEIAVELITHLNPAVQ